jgi:hypothetical protein
VPRLFIPSGVLTLVFGVRLVFEGPWSFGDLWILVGLAGWIAAWGSDSYHQATGGTRDSPCNDLGTGSVPVMQARSAGGSPSRPSAGSSPKPDLGLTRSL